MTSEKPQASRKAGLLSFREKVHRMTGIPADDLSVKVKPQTIREFERALQTLGFSQRESKAVASGGFKAIHPY